MPLNITPKDEKKKSAGGSQYAQKAKGDPGGRMFSEALRRLGTKKGAERTASSSNVARQGLAKVDRVTGPRKMRGGTTRRVGRS